MKNKKILTVILGSLALVFSFGQSTGTSANVPNLKNTGPNPNIERMRIVNEKAAADKAAATESDKNKQANAQAQIKARQQAAASSQPKQATVVNATKQGVGPNNTGATIKTKPAAPAGSTNNGVLPPQNSGSVSGQTQPGPVKQAATQPKSTAVPEGKQ